MKYKLTQSDQTLLAYKPLILSKEGRAIREFYLYPNRGICNNLSSLYPWVKKLIPTTRFGQFILSGEEEEIAMRLAGISNLILPIIPTGYRHMDGFTLAFADDRLAVKNDIKQEKLPWYSQILSKEPSRVAMSFYKKIATWIKEGDITAEDLLQIYGSSRFFTYPHRHFNIYVINGYVFFLNK